MSQLQAYRVLRNRHGPEDTTVRYSGIVIVELEIVVTKLVTHLEDVHSKEGKGPLTLLAVHSDVGPLHEAYIGGERQVRGLGGDLAGLRIELGAGARAVNIQDRQLAMKIEDGRPLRPWAGQKEVEEAVGKSQAEGVARIESAGNGSGRRIGTW